MLFGGLLIIFGLSYWRASSNFHQGESYLKAKDHHNAVLAFEQAILNHFPGSPYQNWAVGRLLAIGDQASKRQDIPLALQAYQAILFAKTSLSVYRNISEEDARLAVERLRKINPEWIGPKIPKHFPDRFWSLAMGIFLLAWIFSLIIFIQFGFDKEGKIKTPAAYYPLGSFMISLLLWLSAMINL
jgi:hypothetical protein